MSFSAVAHCGCVTYGPTTCHWLPRRDYLVNDTDLFNRFILATSIAAGAGTCGLGFLLFAPKRLLGRACIVAVGLALMSGLAVLLTPQYLAWVAGSGALISMVGLLASTALVQEFVGRVARRLCRPRAVGLLALLAAGAMWGHEVWRYESSTAMLMDETLARSTEAPAQPTIPVGTALTDRGSTINLHSPAEVLPAAEMSAIEQKSAALSTWSGRYIQRGAASDESNCHGWVFTGGKFNVPGRLVDTILTDNGYTPASTPAVGDLCVYRASDNQVAHTAVVRAVLVDGTVLVEGKWGRMGVYLHAAGESCYGPEFTYHRTARGGHLLNGLEERDTATTSTP